MDRNDFLKLDAADLPDYQVIANTYKLDANENIFFARELEYIKARTYDRKYPELTALMNIPVTSEAGQGAETITYRSYDSNGVARIVANFATDFPRADVTGKEFTASVKSLGSSYGYNVQEVRAARMAGKPLEQRRAAAARMAIDQKTNQIAYFGDTTNNIPGLLTNTNITAYTLPTDGTGSSAKIKDKSADQIIRDFNGIINGVKDLTNGVESVDTVLMPISVYTYIKSTPRSTMSDTTILSFIETNNPGVTFKAVPEMKGAGTAGADLIFAYKNDGDHLSLEIPQPFEQFAPQLEGMEYKVPCHQRIAGVLNYYPLACVKASGC